VTQDFVSMVPSFFSGFLLSGLEVLLFLEHIRRRPENPGSRRSNSPSATNMIPPTTLPNMTSRLDGTSTEVTAFGVDVDVAETRASLTEEARTTRPGPLKKREGVGCAPPNAVEVMEAPRRDGVAPSAVLPACFMASKTSGIGASLGVPPWSPRWST